MTVKVVADSVCDLPAEIVRDLDITIIPISVVFGDKVYRDGIDITTDEFYEKLDSSPEFPTTAVPPPAEFFNAYDKAAQGADEVLVLTLSSSLSGLYNAAKMAAEEWRAGKNKRIEVIDTRWVIMAEGFLTMKAARMARQGAKMDEIIEMVKRDINRLATRGVFDTLKYLRRGGRISNIAALMGNLMHIHPIVGLKNGVVESFGRKRSMDECLEYLQELIMSYKNIEELSVGCYKAVDWAEKLIDMISPRFPRERIIRSRTSPVIGAHCGPNLLIVCILGDQ